MSSSSTKQFSGIFISYRREDSSGHAGRLFDRLVEHFGRDRIFMDIDTIEPGEDFVTVIENAVGSCELLIAVIGRNWLSAGGTGRLDNPNDFVRLEIAAALRRNIRVIPVLVQRASLPKPQDLPEDLVKLSRRNAVELSDLRWQSDVDQLITVMERVLTKQAEAEQLAEAKPSDEEQERERSEEVDRRKRKVAAGAAWPAHKNTLLILISGASLVVLLTAAILIWQSQKGRNSPSNINQAPTPQPSLVAEPAPATPTQTQPSASGNVRLPTNTGSSSKPEEAPSSDSTEVLRSESDRIVGYSLISEGPGLAVFKVDYKYDTRHTRPMYIKVIIYGEGEARAGSRPFRKRIAEGVARAPTFSGQVSVEARKQLGQATQSDFIEVQLLEERVPLNVKQYPLKRLWGP